MIHSQPALQNRMTGEIVEVSNDGPQQPSPTVPNIWENTVVWMSWHTGNGDIYGATLKVADGDKIEEGEILMEWDPHTDPILTEVGGQVKFGDIIDNVTMQEKVDLVTGKSSKAIIESREPEMRPRISIKD